MIGTQVTDTESVDLQEAGAEGSVWLGLEVCMESGKASPERWLLY